MLHVVAFILVALAAATPVPVQSTITPATQTPRPTTNADVVAMAAAKLSEAVIIAAIQQAPTNFDLSPAGLIELKKAGVPDRVIEAMQTVMTSKSPSVGTKTPTATVLTSPMVLTTRFAASDQSLWGKGEWFTVDEYWELGKFTCDGVSLRQYEGRAQEWNSGIGLAVRLKDPSLAEVKVLLAVHNPKNNHDKGVTIVVEVLDGSTLVATAAVGPLKAEEGHADTAGQASFTIPVQTLRQPGLTLRLTMTVRDI